MSLHRYNPKRDKNEPAIVKTLEANGCLVWPLSGKGIPDLLVFYRRKNAKGAELERRTFVADVKGAKEKPTPAQVEKWTALTALGFSVFVLRTPEDAVAMLNNALQPWEPPAGTLATLGNVMKRVPRKNGAAGRRKVEFNDAIEEVFASRGYTPPRSTSVDAAKEAEETFAPVDLDTRECGCIGRKHRLACLSQIVD